MEREKLGSRLGFILISAGCAIGIGNVWKFPYVTGQNGGGIFVLIYLFFLLIMGIPVMTMEFAMGRASRKSPAMMYKMLEPKGSKWHWQSYVNVIGNYMIMMFYTTVAGWMIHYFVSTAAGSLHGLDSAGVESFFNNVLANPGSMVGYMAIAVGLGFLICSLGLQNGLERVTKVMMSALLIIMVVLAVNSMFMKGGAEGMKFYLLPSVERASEIGWGTVIVSAMNQAFFTLSLGIGSMAIFGSYIGKERSLLGESVNIAVLDTFVAITSGLIIFPACFAYNVEVTSGPGLIFVTLPNIFNNMPGGRVWGSLFFVFMSFAALSTVLAVFESIISCTMDLTGWSRKKTCLVNGIALFVLSIPCALGFNLLSGFKPFGDGSSVMDLEDFFVSNLFLPLGSLVTLLFCVTNKGWGWKNYLEEVNTGKGMKIKKWMKGYLTYVLPILFTAVFVIGLYNVFVK